MYFFIKTLRPRKVEHWLMLSIFIYSFGLFGRHITNTTIGNTFVVFGFLVFIYNILKYRKQINLVGASRFFYVWFIIWSVCLTFHMFLLQGPEETKGMGYGGTIHGYLVIMFISLLFVPNMMPFALLSLRNNSHFDFSYFVRLMTLMAFFYILFSPVAIWYMSNFNWTVGVALDEKGSYQDFISNSTLGIRNIVPATILIFLFKYISWRKWMFFLVTYLCNIFMLIYMARRGSLVLFCAHLLLVWWLYISHEKSVSKLKLILFLGLAIILGYSIFVNYSDSLFSLLLERGTIDTRNIVEQSFYSDFNTLSDFIFGRGWFGEYYEIALGTYRPYIETGFLAVLLRGGFLLLIPYVILMLIGAFNGYFRSRNILCKSLGLLLFMNVVSLYPFGWPEFNFNFFIFWVGIFICNKKYYRNLSDRQIKQLFFSNI